MVSKIGVVKNVALRERIIYSYIGRETIMIHKMYFGGVGKILDISMIESFASSIEGL